MFANDSSHRNSDVLLDASDDYGSFSYNQPTATSFRESARQQFQTHRKKLLFIGVFLILAFTVGLAIIITRPDEDPDDPPISSCTCLNEPPPKASGRPFSIDQLFSNQLSVSYSTLSWSTADDCLIEKTRAGDIVKYVFTPAGNETVKLVDRTSISQFGGTYWYSNDYSHWLFRTDYQSLYRHSGVGQYWLLSVDPSADQSNNQANQPVRFPSADVPMRLQYAAFSPSLTNPSVAYVYQNNIYLYDLSSAQSANGSDPPADTIIQVTTDGSNNILNGVLDWAYEEEVFSQTQSIWWNSQSTSFIYLSINQSTVPSYTFPLYDFPVNQEYSYKYPLVDQTISYAQVGFYRVGDAHGQLIEGLIELSVDPLSDDASIYVIDVVWLNETSVAIKLMPRLQTTYQVYNVDLSTRTIKTLNEDDNQLSITPAITKLHAASDPYYIDSTFFMRPVGQTTNQYIDIGSINDRQHIALYHSNGTLSRWLTSSPDWSVANIHCFYQSANQSYLYFTANYPTSIDRTLHSVDLQTGRRSIMVDWDADHHPNVWQTASFSKHCTQFKLSEESFALTVNLYEINSADPSKASLIKTLKDNESVKRVIRQSMESKDGWALPSVVQSSFPSTVAQGAHLNAHWIIPPTYKNSIDDSNGQSTIDLFDNPDCSVKYPLLLNPYGGPGSSQVSSRYKLGGNGGSSFATFLASSLGVMVLVVDPVGTGQQSDSFQKNYTTLKLGISEQRDFWGVIEQVKQLCFVDPERIAFWGHSYGGFMATRMALSQPAWITQSLNSYMHSSVNADTFRLNTVIAGAPVTDWRLYDAIYTERYMRRSIDNAQGYQDTSTIFRSSSQSTNPMTIQARNFYLLHGTADDNVHYQNAALLAQNLTRNSVQFHQFAFVNRNHGFNPFNGWGQASNATYTSMHYYVMISRIFENMIYQPILDNPSATTPSPTQFNGQIGVPSALSSMDSFASRFDYDLDELDRMYNAVDVDMRKERLGERDRM